MKFLKDLKEGDVCVCSLVGGGFSTESLTTIEYILNNKIYIEGCDGDFSKDSVYEFSNTTGKSVNNFMTGWYSQLVRIATEEDLLELEGE